MVVSQEASSLLRRGAGAREGIDRVQHGGMAFSWAKESRCWEALLVGSAMQCEHMMWTLKRRG